MSLLSGFRFSNFSTPSGSFLAPNGLQPSLNHLSRATETMATAIKLALPGRTQKQYFCLVSLVAECPQKLSMGSQDPRSEAQPLDLIPNKLPMHRYLGASVVAREGRWQPRCAVCVQRRTRLTTTVVTVAQKYACNKVMACALSGPPQIHTNA